MAATPGPVEVGARGTVASLLLQEIEYFKKLDRDRQESRRKPKPPLVDAVFTSLGCRYKPVSDEVILKKKKKTNGGTFLPRICSVVEITDNIQAERIKKIGYKSLRADGKALSPPQD